MTNFIQLITQHGTYYCPATKHYDNPSTVVHCDGCGKSNLTSCIGYDKYDLCLPCADTASKTLSQAQVKPTFPSWGNPSQPRLTDILERGGVSTFMMSDASRRF